MVFDTFTAANTAKGFFSYFDEVLYTEGARKIYLIKGGPGCGKSTFMKKVATYFDEKGCRVERILCSSDRESLDGVIIDDIKTVIIDATPPHSYDMKYPGALESIIDFSVFWDCKRLEKKQNEIKELSYIISSKYRYVYSLLKAVGNMEIGKTMVLESIIDSEKISAAIKKIIKQSAIFPKDKNGSIKNRFLSAFTGDGVYTLSETADSFCDKCVVLEDGLNIGYTFLQKAAVIFSKMGYDVIKMHSPIFPESKPTALFIPELKVGFITSGNMFSPDINEHKIIKKISVKAFIDKEFYSTNKNKISFEKKLVKEIISTACAELGEIKTLHDKLESIYIDATDYNKVNKFTENFVNKI